MREFFVPDENFTVQVDTAKEENPDLPLHNVECIMYQLKDIPACGLRLDRLILLGTVLAHLQRRPLSIKIFFFTISTLSVMWDACRLRGGQQH